MTSGIISVLSTLWFDNGYMYCVSLRRLVGPISHVFPREVDSGRRLHDCSSVFSAELGSTSDTCTSSVYGCFRRSSLFLFVVSLGDDMYPVVSVFSAELGSSCGYMHCVRLRSLFKRLTYLLHEGRLGSPYSALRLVHLWIHARVCLLRLGIFTDFLREGGLGPCGGRRPGGQVEQFHGCCLCGCSCGSLDLVGPCAQAQGQG